MGRSIDQDVHAAFVEFRQKDDDKCLSVQCIYCQQIRAKNTSRQKAHLLECPGLQNHPSAQRPQQSPDADISSSGYAPSGSNINGSNANISTGPAPNGVNGTPTPQYVSRPSLPPQPGPSQTTTPIVQRSIETPKPKPKPTPNTGSNLPAPPLDDVHAAFVEFRAKEDDKCLSVQCIYCNQIRAKNTSRQRQHLLECVTYLNVMKDSIPANNLLHRFDEGDIARSIALPTPSLELDFRVSIKLNPRISVGSGTLGHRNWLSYVGGQWAGRWGKGVVIPGGQDIQVVTRDQSTKMSATYLMQTHDEPPAFVSCRTTGWYTGSKELLEQMSSDAEYANSVAADQYKWRVTIELETGDERYAFLNSLMWVGSGCKRGSEVIYDAYRIN